MSHFTKRVRYELTLGAEFLGSVFFFLLVFIFDYFFFHICVVCFGHFFQLAF